MKAIINKIITVIWNLDRWWMNLVTSVDPDMFYRYLCTHIEQEVDFLSYEISEDRVVTVCYAVKDPLGRVKQVWLIFPVIPARSGIVVDWGGGRKYKYVDRHSWKAISVLLGSNLEAINSAPSRIHDRIGDYVAIIDLKIKQQKAKVK